MFSCPKGKGCAFCDRLPHSSGKRGEWAFPGCAPAWHPTLHGELQTPNISCRKTHFISAGRKLHPLFSHRGSCRKLLMAFATGEPSLLEQGFLRQVAGQVAEGRLGLLRAAPSDPAGTGFLILLQCADSSGPVGFSCSFCRGSRFLRYLLVALGTCGGVVFGPNLLHTGLL